jgi:O-antigen ligase
MNVSIEIHKQKALSIAVIGLLPLLMLFPHIAGYMAGIVSIIGIVYFGRHREMKPMDWQFAVICLVLPISILWNMLLMGWTDAFIGRASVLIWGWFIYYLVSRIGLSRNTVFYGAVLAAFAAVSISLYEAVILGQERVFGLGMRWNAVSFGNYSLLFGFFCLCGAFTCARNPKEKLHRVLGLAGFASGVSASILSGTRVGWLAIPFLLALCCFFNQRLSLRARVVSASVLCSVIAIALVSSDRVQHRVGTAMQEVTSYLDAPDTAASKRTSTGMRLSMWSWGIEKFRSSPLTGIGLAAYSEQRHAAVREGEMPLQFARMASLHNEIITSLALGGIPAAAAVLLFWVLAWRFYARHLRTMNDEQHYYALCGLTTVLGTALFAMTGALFGTSPSTKALMLTLVLTAGALHHSVRQNLTEKR